MLPNFYSEDIIDPPQKNGSGEPHPKKRWIVRFKWVRTWALKENNLSSSARVMQVLLELLVSGKVGFRRMFFIRNPVTGDRWFETFVCCFHPDPWENDPIWRTYFFKWVENHQLESCCHKATARIRAGPQLLSLSGLAPRTCCLYALRPVETIHAQFLGSNFHVTWGTRWRQDFC